MLNIMALRIHVIFLMFFIFPTQIFAQPFSAKEKQVISNKINDYIKKTDPSINVGIEIRDASTGAIIFQKNNNRIYTPASSLKILTAIAGLQYLGPQYQFTTELLSSGAIKDNRLEGDVILKFSGDPTLTMRDIDALFATLRKKGVKTITGNLYVDSSAFDDVGIGPGWMWDELRFCYAAPVGAVIVNHNCMPFEIYPGARTGNLARANMKSDAPLVEIINTVQTVSASQQASCPLEMNIDDDNKIHMSGCLASGKYNTNLEASVTNLEAYVSAILKKSLLNNQMVLQGTIKQGGASLASTLVDSKTSEPLSELMTSMLKRSDNVIANAIYKKIGQTYFHGSATWSNSQKAELALLHKFTGMPLLNITAIDGSGLSRYNQVTPNALVTTLVSVYRGKYFSTFYNALPISGIDGALKYRLSDRNMTGRVHAKTGTMSSVKTIAGYVKTAHHDTLAFVIMVNGFRGPNYKYKTMQDNIISYLGGL